MLKNLIISAGSMKTIATLGCLQYLEEHSLLKTIDRYIGTSAGAIICLFLILGYEIQEIKQFLTNHVVDNEFHKLTLDEVFNLNVLQSFGMDSGKHIGNLLKDILYRKLNIHDISFLELTKQLGKHLVICVANLTTRESEYFSVETHPHASILLAIRMSLSIPFIFTPIEYKNNLYVDGGIFESLPIKYIERFKDPLRDTLAIRVLNKNNQTFDNLLNYTLNLLDAIVDKANKLEKMSDKIKLLDIHFDNECHISFNFETMTFDFDSQIIDKYISKGYSIMHEYFEEGIE